MLDEKLCKAAALATGSKVELVGQTPVVETFQGQVAWEGIVSEFESQFVLYVYTWAVEGHPEIVTMLKKSPADSPPGRCPRVARSEIEEKNNKELRNMFPTGGIKLGHYPEASGVESLAPSEEKEPFSGLYTPHIQLIAEFSISAYAPSELARRAINAPCGWSQPWYPLEMEIRFRRRNSGIRTGSEHPFAGCHLQQRRDCAPSTWGKSEYALLACRKI